MMRFFALAAMLGCGAPVAVVNGSIGGQEFEASDAVAYTYAGNAGSGLLTVWITETALATALNASFLAENVALFGIVVGLALLLTGIGFGVLVIGGSLRGRELGFHLFGERTPGDAGTTAVPVA